ncbi:type IX secretion system membrane protein PorP/SprF, partial [Capnocytophaga canimorsus]
MKRSNRFVLILMLMFSVFGYSQQESQYTQYMYNTMQFNPGYTGSRGVGSLFGL